ncbi:hypothetical protein D3C72_680280 [compost metagenome]
MYLLEISRARSSACCARSFAWPNSPMYTLPTASRVRAIARGNLAFMLLARVLASFAILADSAKLPSSKAVIDRFRMAKISSSFRPISVQILRFFWNDSQASSKSPWAFWPLPIRL